MCVHVYISYIYLAFSNHVCFCCCLYRVLGECDVQMYWQAGGLRDDLIIHEKALDILVELLKKEQVRWL